MTAQVPEVLILDDTTHPMTFCPPLPPDRRQLNYNIRHENFTTEGPDGTVCVRAIARWTDAHGIERAAPEDEMVFTPACWRKYRGTWKIKDGWFYLTALTGCVRLARPGPLLADWFTGVLRVPLGGEVRFIDMGFATEYEQELHIMVESGVVGGWRIHDHRPPLRSYFLVPRSLVHRTGKAASRASGNSTKADGLVSGNERVGRPKPGYAEDPQKPTLPPTG